MSEENVDQTANNEEPLEPESAEDASEAPAPRRFFTRRNGVIALGVTAIIAVILVVLVTVSYRTGVFDNYIKTQFVAKMQQIGIDFSADTFRVTVAPLKLELRNATFNNRVTGAKIGFVREANLYLTVQDLYAWQLSRDISIDTTEINGAEVFVNFDENGKSNFAELNFVEERGRVNFLYSSVRFSLKDGVVHYGDAKRRLAGDANNILFTLEPVDPAVPDEQKRYRFDFTSTNSNFVYEDRKLEPIDIRAQGIADRAGTEITGLRLTTPIGESTLKGTTAGWESPRYDLEIESTVDLTQTTEVFPVGTPLRGIGNFKGKVTGEGENYQVAGEIFSESLSASNIYLKGLNVNATATGAGSTYEANGKAIAQMLTFEDFKIDFPQLVGTIRGTGTDFRWVGELQAAAARTPLGTIGGLFIRDAVAEYKEEKLGLTLGNTTARSFVSEDFNAQNVQVRDIRIDRNGETTNVTAPSLSAGNLKTKAFELEGAQARNIRVKDVPARTDIQADGITARSARIEDNRLRNLTANGVRIGKQGGTTTFDARTLTADGTDAGGARIGQLTAENFALTDVPSETIVAADNLKVAKIETNAAVLGSLNIAGVRLTIRQGRIEGRSGDIDAGTVTLVKNSNLPDGGRLENVRVNQPVFVLEPSGAYRASADLSLGGGVLGSIQLGAARAAVVATSERVELNNLTADVMNGKLAGNATIAYNARNRSEINADFTNLDLAKLLALQGGRVVPVEGEATGRVNLSFAGTNFRTASGNLTADLNANAGTADRGLIPVTGRVEATATNGLFSVDVARLNTASSELTATGSFDLNGYNSNLNLALNSSDAREIERILRVLNLSPAIERQLDEYQAEFAGNLKFNGTLTGNVSDPTIEGSAALDTLILRGRTLGSFKTDIAVSPAATELKNGLLTEPDGGTLAFNATIPRGGANNIAVQATLTNINTGNILAALPVSLPETLRGLQADTSGTLNLTGLPDNMQGEANLTATNGSLRGETFDRLETRVLFSGTTVNLERFQAQFASGTLTANGTYQTDTTAFDFNVEGRDIPFARIAPFIPNSESLPDIAGVVNVNARAVGRTEDSRTYEINFNGTGTGVTLNGNALGTVAFNGKTENQRLDANVTANLQGQQQQITANVNFANPDLPFRAETTFQNTELEPFFALVRGTGGVPISGRATGTVYLAGNLSTVDASGQRVFSTDNLSGSADFSQLALQIGDTPLTAAEPVAVRFNTREIVFESARFSGGGSNLTVSGTVALQNGGVNNLNIDGRVNLSILNAISQNAFFAGLADVNVRLTGPSGTARLNGTAVMQNASASAFIGSERVSFERIKGRILFTSNQAQIDELTGFLGGGRFTASGGAVLDNNLNLQAFRFSLSGNNVTVPLPKDFLTSGDAEIAINGRRRPGEQLTTFISGRINARRSLYSRNIDLADVIGGRGDGSITQGGGGDSTFGDVRLDLIVEGRDALVVRNNLADLTASLSLRVTGDLESPQVTGRIFANSGTIFFRNDRYEVQRGELTFPPNAAGIEPIVNLQAETEIAGYQIFVNLNGPLTDTQNLSAQLRSNPALPQADVISLITTGNLSNTETGIPTLAQSGINTAAEILTNEIINKPISRATDKLFGLNRFQLDPIISGQRLNPTARLTVGRQINRNLLVTYSTNLSEDQNQVLALEYRVSNRLSFVAQYEQRSLSNVTRNRDNFSVEIRLRKRF